MYNLQKNIALPPFMVFPDIVCRFLPIWAVMCRPIPCLVMFSVISYTITGQGTPRCTQPSPAPWCCHQDREQLVIIFLSGGPDGTMTDGGPTHPCLFSECHLSSPLSPAIENTFCVVFQSLSLKLNCCKKET